jgi:putative hydrolase of the HAD superfamily
MAKMVVFDYGRTLYDRETDNFFPDAVSVISTLSKKYRLSIVSVSRVEGEEGRIKALRENGIIEHFEEILFTASGEEKSEKYNELLQRVGLNANEVVVVDDYIIRGIAWGNKSGATTIWFQNGKFANLKPDDETGQPNYTVHSLSELIGILN